VLSLCLPYGPVHIDLSRFLPSLLLFFWDGNLFYTVCSTDYILYQYVLKWRYVGIYSVFIIKNLSNIIACSRSQLIVWGWCHFICNSCFVNIVLFRKFVLIFLYSVLAYHNVHVALWKFSSIIKLSLKLNQTWYLLWVWYWLFNSPFHFHHSEC